MQPLNIAMVISADGSAAAKGIDQAKREVQSLGTAAKTSATGVAALATANDQAAAAAQRAAQAAIGQSQAEVQARNAVALSTGQLRAQTANLAFQFQDIGTMLASGQNPFILLAQQLPQITMHGGQLNGIMGALRQTLSGLFSPLGLLTTGFVLAASAAISYFTDVEDESTNAELTLDEQRTLIRQVADEWGGLVPALRAYAEELERVEKSGKLSQATSNAIASEFQQAKDEIPAIREELLAALGDFRSELTGALGEDTGEELRAVFREYNLAVKDLEKTLKEGGDASQEMTRYSSALAALLANDSVNATDQLTAAVTRLQNAYAGAASAATTLAQQRASADLGERELGLLGTVPPLFSGGGGFIDANDVQTRRANATKSEYQLEQERLARRRPRKTDAQRDAERYDQIVGQAERAIEMEMLQAQALGMTGEAADRLRITQELLNQARAAGIALGPEQVAELTALGATMAQVTAETQAQSDAMELRRDIITDVIGGIRQAAEDGKITMQELLDISMRVLDRIIDKIQNELIDALMNVSGSGGGGGGLSGLIGKLLGGTSLSPAASGVVASGGMTGLFETGGYTGAGDPSRVAGLVHRGEYVVSAQAVRNIGLGNLERMHRTAKSGRGYADGGFVGVGMMAGGGMGGEVVDVRISVDDDGNLKRFVNRTSRAQAQSVLYEAGPQLVNAATQSTMSSIARGDADDTMSSRFGVEARARRLG